MKNLFVFFVVFFNLGVCFAQETVELEKIIVTPYKTGVKEESATAAVNTLDVGQQYRKGNYKIEDALAEDSSVMAVKAGGLGGATSVFLRGNASYHTRFLLDGVKVYDPILTQAYYNPAHLYLNGIEKVEISKGQQSSLYGSDAIGGVISLMTKKAKEPFSFSYLQEYGRYNTVTEQLDLESKKEKFGYVFSILRFDSGGFSATQEKEGNHERDPYHNTNISLRADYDANENLSLGLVARSVYAKYEYDGSAFTFPWQPNDDDDRWAYNYEGIGTVFLDHQVFDNLKQRFQVAYTRFRRENRDGTNASIDDWFDAKTYQTEYKIEYAPWEFYNIVTGVDYTREKGDFFSPSGDFPKSTLNNKSIYFENIFTPFENIFLSFSYRRDDHSCFGGQDTKKAEFSYLIEKTDTKFKWSYGEGFKAPSMYQLYAPASLWGPIGNSSLSPEYSKTYEMGLKQGLFDNIKIEATYFRTFFRDLIDFVSGTGYTNVSKARIFGIETNLAYEVNPNLNVSLGYSWLDTENKENHAQLERRPDNKINLSIKGIFDKWETYFDFSYVGHRTQGTAGNTLLKPYLLAGASVWYHAKDNLDLFLRGENLLDKDYELVDHYQVKRLSFYIGAKLTF